MFRQNQMKCAINTALLRKKEGTELAMPFHQSELGLNSWAATGKINV